MPERLSIEPYGALCLIALDVMNEADEAIASTITSDPLYRPADAELPARLWPMLPAVASRLR